VRDLLEHDGTLGVVRTLNWFIITLCFMRTAFANTTDHNVTTSSCSDKSKHN